MKLLVTADDFGYCPKRNEAIFKLLESGKISRTSLMVNVPVYSEEAAKMIRNGFENRIGLHFNITEGRPLTVCESLSDDKGDFLGKTDFWSKAQSETSFAESEVEKELKSQIEKFIKITGLHPSHVDGHQHAHLAKNIFPVFLRILDKYKIAETRLSYEFGLDNENNENLSRFLLTFQLHGKKCKFYHRKENSPVIVRPFIGHSLMGKNLTLENLEKATDYLEDTYGELHLEKKDQIPELMVHPGYCSTPKIGGLPEPDEFSISSDREHELNMLENLNFSYQIFIP